MSIKNNLEGRLEKVNFDGNDLSKKDLGDVTFKCLNNSLSDFVCRSKLKHFGFADCKLEASTLIAIGEGLELNSSI
jgi:hypothetical protein